MVNYLLSVSMRLHIVFRNEKIEKEIIGKLLCFEVRELFHVANSCSKLGKIKDKQSGQYFLKATSYPR